MASRDTIDAGLGATDRGGLSLGTYLIVLLGTLVTIPAFLLWFIMTDAGSATSKDAIGAGEAVRSSAMLMLAFTTVVLSAAAIVIVWLILRPFQELIEAARRVSQGEQGVAFKARGPFAPVEINAVADAMSAMSAKVAKLNCDIERRVAERTATTELALAKARLGYHQAREEALERCRAEEELKAANAALSKANEAKSRFLATMGHELRTPMNGVIGMLEPLMSSSLDGRQAKLGKAALQSAEAFVGILEDVLEYSRLTDGCDESERVSFDLSALIRETADVFLAAASVKSLSLHVSIEPDAPCWVAGDASSLRRALMKLIDNAIKFTPAGVVVVSACCVRSGDGRTRARLEVADSGIGIAEEARGRIFDSFIQADASISRRYAGSGLGLSIARKAIERMGGRLDCSSKVGQGSTFWIELVLDEVEQTKDAASDETANVLPPVSPLRVLVAEDNPINQLVAEQILLDAGHTVDIVQNGIEALCAFGRKSYDLILMDIQMPELDGVEAARRIRNCGRDGRETPIIALTANASPSERVSYLEAGMDEVVPKPFSDKFLFATISRVLEIRRMVAA